MEHFPIVNRLHTDVLEEKYGPIHPEVIRHDDEIREAFLCDEKGVARTYALTFFTHPMPIEIEEIENEIRAGGSIGKTFKKHGYEIRKNVVSVSVLDLPFWLREKFATSEEKAKARFSEFYAKKEEGNPVIYATVLEVYTPDFRKAELNHVDLIQINPPTHVLEKQGITKNDVWERITSGNDWEKLREKYDRAKKGADRDREALEAKATEYIASK